MTSFSASSAFRLDVYDQRLREVSFRHDLSEVARSKLLRLMRGLNSLQASELDGGAALGHIVHLPVRLHDSLVMSRCDYSLSQKKFMRRAVCLFACNEVTGQACAAVNRVHGCGRASMHVPHNALGMVWMGTLPGQPPEDNNSECWGNFAMIFMWQRTVLVVCCGEPDMYRVVRHAEARDAACDTMRRLRHVRGKTHRPWRDTVRALTESYSLYERLDEMMGLDGDGGGISCPDSVIFTGFADGGSVAHLVCAGYTRWQRRRRLHKVRVHVSCVTFAEMNTGDRKFWRHRHEWGDGAYRYDACVLPEPRPESDRVLCSLPRWDVEMSMLDAHMYFCGCETLLTEYNRRFMMI